MAAMTIESTEIQELASELSRELTAEYGPMLGSEALVKVLGYRSSGAFQQAITRGIIGFCFDVPPTPPDWNYEAILGQNMGQLAV